MPKPFAVLAALLLPALTAPPMPGNAEEFRWSLAAGTALDRRR